MSAPGFRQALALLLDREQATESLASDSDAAYTVLSPANESWFDADEVTTPAEIVNDPGVQLPSPNMFDILYDFEDGPVYGGGPTPSRGRPLTCSPIR